jgi:hypothetical protein
MSKKNALIYGFIGRQNFGDELMLELHKEILCKLGYSVYLTTNSMFFPYMDKNYIYNDRIIKNHNDLNFDLILFGGGALPSYFGIDMLLKARIQKPSIKIIGSSLNIFRESVTQKLNFEIYNTVFDGLIFREKINEETKDLLKIPNIFLPDIVTTLKHNSNIKEDKIAVILRNEIKKIENAIIIPDEPCEILVMSKDDLGILSNSLLSNIPSKVIYEKPAKEQYEILKSYKKILSQGRFHAALCNKDNFENNCYLYPFIEHSYKPYSNIKSWEDIKQFESIQHMEDTKKGMRTKTGEHVNNFYKYPSCTESDYLNFIQGIIN